LTDGNDIFDADDFTTAADTVTADQDTYASVDVIAEPNSGDGDTLTITTDADITLALPTIVGIENIVVNSSQFAGAGDGINFAATGITSGTLTLNNVQVGSADDTATVTGVGSLTVVAGENVSTFDVTMVEDAVVTINAGSATEVQLTSTGADQAVSVIVNGDAAVDLATGTDLNLTATVASSVTFDASASAAVDTITGDANVSLVGDAGAGIAEFDGLTITGVAGVSGAGGNADLTGVAAPITITDDTASAIIVADGANVTAELVSDGDTIELEALDDEDTDVDAEQSVTLTLTDDSSDVAGTAGYTIVLDDNTTDDGNEITTLNLVVSGELDHDLTSDDGDVAISIAANALDTTINVSGAGGLDIHGELTAGTGDLTFNAAAMTGGLVIEALDEMVSLTSGAGADRIDVSQLTAAEEITIAAGSGSDTLVGGNADLTGATLSGFEVIDGSTYGLLASQLHNATYVVHAGAALNLDIAGVSVDVAVMDFSGLTFADATDVITVDLSGGRDAAILLAGQSFEYIGSDAEDEVTGSDNADNISGNGGIDALNGGAGADTISGGAGVDTITGGTGADSLTGGAAADVFVYTTADHSTAAAIDTITDFTAETTFDLLNFDTTGDAHTVSDAEVTDAAAFTNGILTDATVTAAIAADTTLADAITEFLAVTDFDDNDVGAFIWQGNTYVAHLDANNAAGNIVCLEGIELASIVEATSGANAIDQFTGTIA
jgi:Ca2+-binding RTX toxin-like protein